MSYLPSVSAQVIGAGTDYALTNALARIDFGTTDPEIILPTAGMYVLHGTVTFLFSAVASSVGDVVSWAFRNSTDAVTLPADLPAWTNLSAITNNYQTLTGTAIVIVTASKTIQLWATNVIGSRGIVVSGNTSIKYIRLY